MDNESDRAAREVQIDLASVVQCFYMVMSSAQAGAIAAERRKQKSCVNDPRL